MPAAHVAAAHAALEVELEAPAREELSGDADDAPLLAAHGITAVAPRARLWASKELAVNASWAVNAFLFAAKLVVFLLSNSKAVLASLADSAGVPGLRMRYALPLRSCAAAAPLRC
jgi:hypothetical protein